MNWRETRERVLAELARRALDGEIPELEEFARELVETCFPDGDKDRDKKRKILEDMLHFMMGTGEAKENYLKRPPEIVKLISDACASCLESMMECEAGCPVGAIREKDGSKYIDPDLCVNCGLCINSCSAGAIVEKSEFLQILRLISARKDNLVMAILAPSFVGQFGPGVTGNSLKRALLDFGFDGVFEVALAADVITISEAEAFISRIEKGEEFVITSCCCPAFIKLVEKHRPKCARLVSPSVSPMIALGRLLKVKHPGCRVVFIGPCIAKKQEAKLDDIKDAVDCVVTFKEMKVFFDAAGVNLNEEAREVMMDDASHDGRIFAHTGGVTTAIARAIKTKTPELDVRIVRGNGLKECNQILRKIEQGIDVNANFMEGMACPGGCVGGPGTLIDVKDATGLVDDFAKKAPVLAARDNPKAKELAVTTGYEADLDSEKAAVVQQTGKQLIKGGKV